MCDLGISDSSGYPTSRTESLFSMISFLNSILTLKMVRSKTLCACISIAIEEMMTISQFEAVLARNSPLCVLHGRRTWVTITSDNTTTLNNIVLHGFFGTQFITRNQREQRALIAILQDNLLTFKRTLYNASSYSA